ncbi:MAG: hypothetical protein ACRCSO_03145 [Sphingomonas sp.]
MRLLGCFLAIPVALAGLCPQPVLARDALVSQRSQFAQAATCFVRYAARASADVLAKPMYSSQQLRAAKSLLEGNFSCLRDKDAVAIRDDIFYGELAAALLAHDPMLLDRLANMPSQAPLRPAPGLDASEFINAFGECLVRAEPQKSAALLKSERGSTAEREAVLAYGDTLSACTATDIAYHMNIPDLRAHIAISAYRLATGIDAVAAKG